MIDKNIFTTNSSKQTQKMGEILAMELQGGEIICLSGELGSGKTTFTQGVLKGLGVKGPHTSPTFVVLKHYRKIIQKASKVRTFSIFHIDAYRVGSKDILDLGWEEIIADDKNIIIVEWAERIKSIIPKDAIWIKFKHIEKDKRKISIK